MAEEQYKTVVGEHQEREEVEVADRGCLDFFGKKKEEDVKKEGCHQDEVLIVTGVEKIDIQEAAKVEEVKEEEKKESFFEKLHRTHSSSSSSDEEYEEVDGVKKKKKKGLKEKIKEKLGGEKQDEEIKKPFEVKQEHVAEQHVAVATVVSEGYDSEVKVEKIEENIAVAQEEEKKGFLDKIKEKLPGHNKKPCDEAVIAPPPEFADQNKEHEAEGKEKKGILGKIMEKLPGYHKSAGEDKECEKTASDACH